MELFNILDCFGCSDTRPSPMQYRFINYETLWLSVNRAARIRRFLWKQLTLQEETAALLTSYNINKVPLIPLIFSNGLTRASHSVWVQCLGAVSDHTVHKTTWSSSGGTSSKRPKLTALGTVQSDHTGQSIPSLGVKCFQKRFGSLSVSTPLLNLVSLIGL